MARNSGEGNSMNVRKFRLINNNGEEYNLTTKSAFLHTPSGLGYRKDTTYQRLGNLHVVLNDAFEQGQIQAEIFFPEPNSYEKYFDFIRFCQNEPLYLKYKPAQKEYTRKIRIGEVDKTEIGPGGLNITIIFDCLTLFYESHQIYGDASEAEDGKIYTYRYPYRYATSASNTLEIVSDSYADSPCTIYIHGNCVNPVWRHYVNNILEATGAVYTTIPEGEKLAIDTTKTPYSLHRVDFANRLVADVYAASDFNTERFIMLKHGTNRITVSHDNANILTMALEAQIIYASV